MGADAGRHRYSSLSIALSDLLCTRLCCAERKIGNTYILRGTRASDGVTSSSSSSDIDSIDSVGCVVGVHWPGLGLAVALIVFGTVLNVSVVHSSRKLGETFLAREVLYTLICVLCSSTCYNLYKTAFSDPGIITKRYLHALGFGEDNEAFLCNNSMDSYCDMCDIVQPAEMKIMHCYSCDVCIGNP